MNILNKQIYFSASVLRSAVIGVSIGLFLSFILFFVEPFDTNEFQSNNRLILLCGFGVLLYLVYILHSFVERIFYLRLDERWAVKHEVLSVSIYFLIVGTVIYLYNHFIINEHSVYSFESHWWYFKNIVAGMIPLLAPLLIFGRQKLGEKHVLALPNSFLLKGENKDERLLLKRKQVLFIQAMENYVEIHYLGKNHVPCSITFRQTLSKIFIQLPFLIKCHRSYLVNMDHVEEILGNSQKAMLSFGKLEQQIPLSKTLYKSIKDIYWSKKESVDHN